MSITLEVKRDLQIACLRQIDSIKQKLVRVSGRFDTVYVVTKNTIVIESDFEVFILFVMQQLPNIADYIRLINYSQINKN